MRAGQAGMEIPDIVRGILGRWYLFPNKKAYRGDDAPDRLLGDILGLEGGFRDSPGGRHWKIKFASSDEPILLLDEKNTFGGYTVLRDLVTKFGTKDGEELQLCREIWGSTDDGFFVTIDDKAVSITNSDSPETIPAWDPKILLKVMSSELESLITVFGETKEDERGRWIKFLVAIQYTDIRSSEFLKGLAEGWISVRLNSVVRRGILKGKTGQFRIKVQDIGLLYSGIKRLHNKKILSTQD